MNIETLLTDEEIEAIPVTNLGGTVDDLNIAKAQDAKTKRVIAEWLKKHSDFNEYGAERISCGLLLTIIDWQEFKKWALGE